MSWYKTYPKEKTKNDLVGVKLQLIGNKPPEETDKDYLRRVYVMDYENNQEYSVLMTLRDIGNVIDLPETKFTFKIPKGEEWAEVVKVD